jgi:hypothetical protein
MRTKFSNPDTLRSFLAIFVDSIMNTLIGTQLAHVAAQKRTCRPSCSFQNDNFASFTRGSSFHMHSKIIIEKKCPNNSISISDAVDGVLEYTVWVCLIPNRVFGLWSSTKAALNYAPPFLFERNYFVESQPWNFLRPLHTNAHLSNAAKLLEYLINRRLALHYYQMDLQPVFQTDARSHFASRPVHALRANGTSYALRARKQRFYYHGFYQIVFKTIFNLWPSLLNEP